MSLADFLPPGAALKLASATVSIGDVYEMDMDPKSGIIPKGGFTSRRKYFIVLGFASDGSVYGGVVINSHINPNLPVGLKMLHMPLKASKYPFLQYNSFVDCAQVKKAFPEKFTLWNFLGKIDDEDTDLITKTLRNSPLETPAHLALFGL